MPVIFSSSVQSSRVVVSLLPLPSKKSLIHDRASAQKYKRSNISRRRCFFNPGFYFLSISVCFFEGNQVFYLWHQERKKRINQGLFLIYPPGEGKSSGFRRCSVSNKVDKITFSPESFYRPLFIFEDQK